MPRTIKHNGVEFVVHAQSFFIPPGYSFWLERPVTVRDIEMVKALIDAGRQSMSREIQDLLNQLKKLGVV